MKIAPFRPLVLEVPDRRRTAKAVDHHNFALDINFSCWREIEEVDAAPGGESFNHHCLAADAAGRRADRKSQESSPGTSSPPASSDALIGTLRNCSGMCIV